METSDKLWIGLAEVVPAPGNNILGSDKKGACINVIAHADAESDFRERVLNALREMGLEMKDLEDVELFRKRASEYQVSQELLDLAQKVEAERNVGFGTFHTFPLDEDRKR
jgi:hypothetical protein